MNPQKGDVPFQAGGKQYVLCYSFGSLVLLEEKLGKGMMQIVREIESWTKQPEHMRLRTICDLLWIGLKRHQPEMTEQQAIDLLDDIDGGIGKVIDLIGESFQKAFSAPGTKATNPPRTTDGTGVISMLNTPV